MATTGFVYTGGVQTFTVPDQCTSVLIECVGAGSGDQLFKKLSTGATAQGTLAVTPGETLYIFVGGVGGRPGGTSRLGGFNGGGNGGIGNNGDGGGGSGASDVRQGGSTISSRVIVAGGAGGYHVISGGLDSTHGGHGGGTTGEDGNGGLTAGSGLGGTQTAGGASSGIYGQGGTQANGGNSLYPGGSSSFPYGPAGGGGGWWGGGSGFPGGTGIGLAGGGGSSYIGGVTGGVLDDGVFLNGTSNGQYPAAAAAASVHLTYNIAPDKPTVPALPTNFRVDQPLPVEFFHNDEPGDGMSAANVRWRPNTLASWVELDNVTVTGDDTDGYVFTFPAHFADAYVGVLLDIEVQTVDSHGAASPWSDAVFSTPVTGGSSTSVVISAPAQIFSQTPSFNFSLLSGDTFVGGKVQCWTDIGGAPGAEVCEIDFEQSSLVTVASFTWDTSGENPGVYDVSDPGFQFTNGSTYHFLVALETTPFVYTDAADSGPIQVTINAPQPADITATPLPNSAPPAILLQIANFTGVDPYVASYNDIYRADLSGDSTENIRIAHGVPFNGSFIDYLPGLSVQYQYTVVPIHVTT